jgi:hypothetical protein
MSAIEHCRTAALGGHVEACEDCGHQRIAYNSCRNRHCPKCQGAAARTWLAEREADLLPVGYFHVVFSIPAELANIAFHNKAVMYDLLFRTASETMLTHLIHRMAGIHWQVSPKPLIASTELGVETNRSTQSTSDTRHVQRYPASVRFSSGRAQENRCGF